MLCWVRPPRGIGWLVLAPTTLDLCRSSSRSGGPGLAQGDFGSELVAITFSVGRAGHRAGAGDGKRVLERVFRG